MARTSRKPVNMVVKPTVELTNYNAAAYVRLSSDDKKKRGDSLETQRNIIENYIALNSDIRLAGLYSDNNATGTNFDRPGFQQMLKDAETGRINCIIVKDLTRFGRNAIDSGYYLEKYLPLLNVRFIAITDGYDSRDGDGGIMLPLKNVIAESYALDISRKCRAVQRQNIADGRFVGKLAPFGYAKSPQDGHKLVVDENAAHIVRYIYDLAARGNGYGEIVRRLNDEKILPPSHYKQAQGLLTCEKLIGTEHWKLTMVRKILSDRVYVGDTVQGKTRTVNHKEIAVDRSEWVCVPSTHEPIITREQFDRVQKLLVRKSETSGETVTWTPNVLTGKVICAKCGHVMKRKRQNDGTYWFRCESQWKISKDACTVVSVKEVELLTEIVAALHKHSEAILGRFIQPELSSAEFDAELREINANLDKDGRMLKSLYESLVSGVLTSDEFGQLKSEYDAKIAELSARADGIRKRKYDADAKNSECRDLAEAVMAVLANDTLTAELIDRLVERIYVSPDKSFEVYFKFADELKEVA